MTDVTLTPVMVETRLRQLVTELAQAQKALADARDAEVDAKHDLMRAKNREILSGRAPKVERGGATVAERDAWVEVQVEGHQFAYDRAQVVTMNAQEHLRTIREQAEIVRSLGASVRQAYEGMGRFDG